MESLALVAAIIVLSIIVLGVLSLITILKQPQSRAGRALVLVVNIAGIISGTWLALLTVGNGARIIGGVVLIVSAISTLRLLSR